MKFKHFGSAKFVVKSAASTILKVVAGAVLVHGWGTWTDLGIACGIALTLVLVAMFVDAEMGLKVHDRYSPLWKTTQILLEEYWASLVKRLVASAHWNEKLHLRFVVYFPKRYGFIGPSYLVPQHYLDRIEVQNTDDYVIKVRTTEGWAGKVFASGKTMVADLERSQDLIKLYLTKEQEDFVVQKLGLKSKICVPLRAGPDHILGVFSVESMAPLTESKFQDAHVTGLIEGVASLVAATCRTAYSLRKHTLPGIE